MSADKFNINTSVPNHDGEPVFHAPWQAQAFAMVVQMHEQKLFTWSEWAEVLSTELSSETGHDENADKYYRHWLTAAEKLMSCKGIFSSHDLRAREQKWHRAAHATPHGEPIELSNDPLDQA